MVNQQLIDWIKNQESQGYSDQQLYNLLIQQGYNPNEINEAIKFAKQVLQPIKQSSKKSIKLLYIIIAGIVLVTLVIGGIFWFVSNQDSSSDLDTSMKETSDEISSDAKLKEENLETIKTEDELIQQRDCGISESLSKDIPINQIDYETDNALVCLANSLLNDCTQSKAILDTFNAGKINFEIREDNGCIVKMEYGDTSQIPNVEQKQYANKYIECPLDIDELKSGSTENPTEKPGTFAFGVYFSIGIQSMNPNTKCTGTVLELSSITKTPSVNTKVTDIEEDLILCMDERKELEIQSWGNLDNFDETFEKTRCMKNLLIDGNIRITDKYICNNEKYFIIGDENTRSMCIAKFASDMQESVTEVCAEFSSDESFDECLFLYMSYDISNIEDFEDVCNNMKTDGGKSKCEKLISYFKEPIDSEELKTAGQKQITDCITKAMDDYEALGMKDQLTEEQIKAMEDTCQLAVLENQKPVFCKFSQDLFDLDEQMCIRVLSKEYNELICICHDQCYQFKISIDSTN